MPRCHARRARGGASRRRIPCRRATASPAAIIEHQRRTLVIAHLAFAEQHDDGTSPAIAYGVQLRVQTALGAPDTSGNRPFFKRLAAVRCAFRAEQVTSSLRRLGTKRLIETPHAHFREIAVSEAESVDDFHFRVTSVGIYHVRYWTGSFSFLDATSTDTPIFEEETRSRVCDLAASFDTRDRLAKATEFRDYLERQWYSANIHSSYYDFRGLVEFQSRTFQSAADSIARANTPNRQTKRR